MPKIIRLYEIDEVDLLEYPDKSANQPINDNCELVLGDLHANPLKLIYLLIQQNIFDLNEEDYVKLAKIYASSFLKFKSLKKLAPEADDAENLLVNYHKLSKDEYGKALAKSGGKDFLRRIIDEAEHLCMDIIKDLETFNTLIMKIKLLYKIKVRLLGDEIFDRGANDYFMLLIFKKMTLVELPFECIISNHSALFMRKYVEGFKNFDHHWERKVLNPGLSMTNLATLVKHDILSINEITELAKQYYIPHIKALSYTLLQESNSIIYYTHAPVGLKTIEALAHAILVDFNDTSAKNLAASIDRINETMTEDLYADMQKPLDPQTDAEAAPLTDPLVRMIWTRRSTKAFLKINNKIDPIDATHNGFNTYLCHGHDGNGQLNHYGINENNDLFAFNMDNRQGQGQLYDMDITYGSCEQSSQPVPSETKLQQQEKIRALINSPILAEFVIEHCETNITNLSFLNHITDLLNQLSKPHLYIPATHCDPEDEEVASINQIKNDPSVREYINENPQNANSFTFEIIANDMYMITLLRLAEYTFFIDADEKTQDALQAACLEICMQSLYRASLPEEIENIIPNKVIIFTAKPLVDRQSNPLEEIKNINELAETTDKHNEKEVAEKMKPLLHRINVKVDDNDLYQAIIKISTQQKSVKALVAKP